PRRRRRGVRSARQAHPRRQAGEDPVRARRGRRRRRVGHGRREPEGRRGGAGRPHRRGHRAAGRRRGRSRCVVTLGRLGRGWRPPYVEAAAATPESETRSPFAAILASGLPDTETNIVWRGEHCFAILNAFPYTNGHLMVMPYREVGELDDLTPEEHS